MAEKQRTIAKPVKLKGRGLHTGLQVEMEIKPAAENHGIIFKRIDLENRPIIHADVNNVVETSRGTVLEENKERVGTIEHVMAGLAGFQIDNALIEITAPEAPIGDGSASQIVKEIENAGVTIQEAPKEFFVVKEKIQYLDKEKGIDITIYPDDEFTVDVLIDYHSPVLGNQYASLLNWNDFPKEIALARTFVFLHELEFLLKHNLIKGGDVDNAIVIIDRKVSQEELDRLAGLFNKPKVKVQHQGILNNIELHYTNEPARHKLLDLIGDLALLGRPIKGKIVALRPGHHANTELGKKISKIIKKEQKKLIPPSYDPESIPVFNLSQIMEKIPHRPPFLLVDRINHMDEWEIWGIKNVTMKESHFEGHSPEEPTMPGVLQIESMAQMGAVLLSSKVENPDDYLTCFLKIENVKFKHKVLPGDTLNIRMRLLEPIKRGIALTRGQGFVGNKMVIEGEFMTQLVRKIEIN